MEPNGKLELTFKRKASGETYLANQYFKMPLQIFPPDSMDEDGSVFLYLLNPSSGMLEGDLFDIRFVLEDGANAMITTPSSNKIYRSNGADTNQYIYAHIGSGSVLEYLPEQNVPYGQSRFFQRSVFEVEKGGTLLTWDCMMPGRLERGEDFDFSIYQSDVSIFYDNKLEIREGMKLVPESMDPHNPAVMGEYAIAASMYVVGESLPEELCNELRPYLSETESICGGISVVSEHLAVIKILFQDTLHLREILWQVWDRTRKVMIGKNAFPIRKY